MIYSLLFFLSNRNFLFHFKFICLSFYLFLLRFIFCCFILILFLIYLRIDGVYHGINGNVSLDRRAKMGLSPQHRYDSTIGSDKSSSLSRSESGIYDVGQAERSAIQQQQENIVNNNLYPLNGNGNGNTSTLESQDNDTARKRVSNRDKWLLFLCFEL